MKPIANLVNLPATQPSAAKPSAPNAGVASQLNAKQAPTWIDELLAKLHAIYGQKWQNHVSGIPYEALRSTWGEALAGWSKADAKRAIDHCAQTMPWPPALPDFIAAKRAGETQEQRAFAARAESEQLALPSRTWAESRAQYRGVAKEILMMLREDEPKAAAPKDDEVELTAEETAAFEECKKREIAKLEAMARRVRGDGAA